MYFPKSKATVTDTWQVIGLRGTGSDDYAVTDLFVPEAYSFTRESDADRRETGPLYLFSIYNMFGMAFCAVALGIARTVLDDFIALAKTKKAHASQKLLSEANLIQTNIGLSEARLGAARAYVLDTYAQWYEQACSRQIISYGQRVCRARRDLLRHPAGARGGGFRLSRRRHQFDLREQSVRAALPRPAHRHPAEPGASGEFRGVGAMDARHPAGPEVLMEQT